MNDELCGHKIKMLAEPCLHCELKKRYDRIENLESLTQGIDWDKWHDAAEILASQEQWRRVAGELERSERELAEQRDHAEEWADKLAEAIALHFREDIGEHSNLNNPWARAHNLIAGNFCR